MITSIIIEIWPVILGCFILSLLLAPLGSIALWKGYGYLSDSLAHSSVLASLIVSITAWPLMPIATMVAVTIVLLIYWLESGYNTYIITNIVASTAIALAIILNHLFPQNVNLTNILFGDILSITKNNLLVLLILTLVSFIFMSYYFKQLVLITLNRDLAKIYQIKIKTLELALLVISAVVISLGVKVVGMLLLNALLIMPAASARLISRTPGQMLIFAIVLAVINNAIGIFCAILFDLPIAATVSISFLAALSFYIY